MVLRVRDFRLLWLGQTVSQLGNQLNTIALSWIVLRETGSSAAMAGVCLAQVLPNALFGWVAGLAVDRFDRRRLMLACSVIRGLLVIALPLSLSAGPPPLALVYGVTFAISTFTLVFYASEKTVIPSLVPAALLTEANAWAEMTSQIAGLAGPVIAGLLVARLPSPTAVLWLDAAGFAASALALSQLHFRDDAGNRTPTPHLREEALAGLHFLVGTPFICALCITAAIGNLVAGPYAVVFPVLSERALETGSVGFGWLMGGFGGGMLAGSLAAPAVRRRLADVTIIYGGMAGVGAGFIGVAAAPSLPVAVMGAIVAGLGITPGNAVTMTLVQQITPPHLQGRVFSTLFALVGVATPLGIALAAPLLVRLGPRGLMLAMGIATIALAGFGRIMLPPQPAVPPYGETSEKEPTP